MVSVHIDYLSGTTLFENLRNMEEFLDDLARWTTTKDEITVTHKTRKLGTEFNWSIDSTLGIYGAAKIRDDEKVRLGFQLPGKFCRAIANQEEAVKTFYEMVKPTRIDIALDDDKRRISQNGLDSIAQKGHYKGAEYYKFIESKHCQDGERAGTCQFGSSDKVIRYYNAEAVHDIPADRWELQARDEYASQIVSILAQHGIADNAGAIVTGAIDFVERGQTWRHERRYEFWESLREETNGTIKLSPPERIQTLEKSLEWLDRQVSPTLAIIHQGLGRQKFLNYMEHLALSKIDKLTPLQKSWIEYLKRSGEKAL